MDLGALEAILLSLHGMGAALLETPELELSKDEGKLLAGAIGKVQAHYSRSIVTEKQMDWINLFSALGVIYGPRMMMIRARHASDVAKDVTPKPAQAARPGAAPVPPASQRQPGESEEAYAFRMLNALHQAS